MAHIKDCLIVAAGKGTRLKDFGDLKPLVDLCGIPLIEHAMRSAIKGGVERFVVVTGYQSGTLETALDVIRNNHGWPITNIFNPAFEKPNGLSVLAGAPSLPDDFYLTMCDHVVEVGLYERLAQATLPDDSVALGVDRRLSNPDVDIDDVTKVKTKGDQILAIGKTLSDYNAFDTGVFRANQSLFDAIRQSEKQSGDCSISGGMGLLARTGRAMAVDIGQARWIDVDSPEMHKIADHWMSAAKTGPPS